MSFTINATINGKAITPINIEKTANLISIKEFLTPLMWNGTIPYGLPIHVNRSIYDLFLEHVPNYIIDLNSDYPHRFTYNNPENKIDVTATVSKNDKMYIRCDVYMRPEDDDSCGDIEFINKYCGKFESLVKSNVHMPLLIDDNFVPEKIMSVLNDLFADSNVPNELNDFAEDTFYEILKLNDIDTNVTFTKRYEQNGKSYMLKLTVYMNP